MSDTLVVLHTAIAIIAIVLLILVVRVDPVIALVIGTIYLGLAAGLGFEDTIGTIAQGFGDIMVVVGLLIGFGVLLGSLLLAMGALQKLVGVLLRLLGPERLPYAFSAALSTVFPAIYVDVQLVLAAPLARSATPRIMDGLEVPALVMALAVGSGALFALQVNSNFFWMFRTLLGVSTQGALKALTLVTALASVVSLVLILPLSLLL